MPIRNGSYVKRSTQEQFETVADELLAQEGDANPRAPSTYTYALLWAVVSTLADNQEQALQDVYQSAYVVDATEEELSKKARNLGVLRQTAQRATGVVEFSRGSAATTDYTIPSGTVVETLADNPVQFETTTTATLTEGSTSVQATVEAIEGGSDGNVGPNSIQAMPSPPTGVEAVTNPDPTGDPSFTDTEGNPLRTGRDREGDDELRQRVLDTNATSQGPSGDGVQLALASTEGVISTHVNTNQESTANNGLDPFHSEVVVYGGDVYDVARTLYETMSATSLLRLQGGVNGTLESTTIYSELFDQNITVPITRPSLKTFTVDVDVVHTDSYGGDVSTKDAIVEYVGGTYADDSTTTGTGIGEDVLVNEMENHIEDVQGVDYADVTLVDANGDGTDDASTDEDGVPILAVSNSEVARIDADDVTITTTAR